MGPGEQARLPVRIRNQSRRVESYRVDVVGEAAAFALIDPPTVSVLPGREAEVSVTFTPPGGASSPTGSVPFAVRATSEVESSYSAVAEGHLELAGVAGLQAWAVNNAAAGRWSGRYQLEFANQGNAAVRLAVTANDPAATLRLTVERDLIDLRPGGRTSSQVKAKVRQPFLRGTPANRIVRVDTQSLPFGAGKPEPGAVPDPSDPGHRTLQLTFQQKPVLSKLALVAIILVAALLIGLLLLQLRKTDELVLDLTAPEAPPTFGAQASGSSSVFLQWAQVPNATGYQIRTTTSAGEMGSEVAAVDAATLSYPVEGLEPGREHCFAVVALGPEGAADSAPTAHQCATTSPPSQLAAPAGLTVTPSGGGVFALQWTYPETDGVEFSVLVDNARLPEQIVGLSTTITLEPRETAYQALVAVLATRDGESSDPSEPVQVTVDALVVAVSTTLPAPATTAPPGPAPTVVPVPVPTTVSGGTPTTTPGTTTTTTVPSPARAVLQDLATTPAAFLGTYRPESQGGLPLEQRKNQLALAFNVPAGEIGLFTNRDTRIRDAAGIPGDLANLSPTTQMFYVARPTAEAAAAVCAQNTTLTCGTFTLQGAPSAAEGTTIVVAQRLDAASSIQEVDATLDQQRAALGRRTVFVLDGAFFQGFSANELVIFVSDLGTPAEIDQFCAERISGVCSRGTLTRTP